MSLRPLFTLLLVLWVGADLMDAARPGVFSFEMPQLFVDGVIAGRLDVASSERTDAPPETPRWTEPPVTLAVSASRTTMDRAHFETILLRPHVMIARSTSSAAPAPPDEH
jgi:hypothetical protein